MQIWTEDEHYHVRQLCNEGTRPRLLCAPSLTLPYDVGIPLLDRLSADPTRYVTWSVANHVNDISKKDPHLALDTLERWRGSGHRLGWARSTPGGCIERSRRLLCMIGPRLSVRPL